MPHKYIFFLPIIVVGSVVGVSCIGQLGENYDIEKTSPNGVYRVKVEIRAEEGKNTTRGYTEHGKYQFFKGQEIISTHEWKNPYQYEPTFSESTPLIEWVDDSVLRMGESRLDQPFYDELIISNNTSESIKYMSVSYGKFELFWTFDLSPKSQFTLHASPGFKPNGWSNYFLGYGGMTQTGKKFEGALESKQRKSPSDGALKFQITINTQDLR